MSQREWLANNVSRAKELLNDCSPDMRHWEWHYLPHYTIPIFSYSPRMKHTGLISPDGRYLASASQLGVPLPLGDEFRVWDMIASKEIFTA